LINIPAERPLFQALNAAYAASKQPEGLYLTIILGKYAKGNVSARPQAEGREAGSR
jgi:hypothetical protein